jgi:hypothetical protein
VITGFNTDVEHDGVVYHVQTEDKGLDSPLILSLVYTGGAILASKRSPYDDLIRSGFNERALSERLQRQHKLICAAIRAGRIEDLKRMSQRDATARAAASALASSKREVATEPPLAPTQSDAPAAVASSEAGTEREAAPLPRSAPPTITVRAIMQETVADFARAEAGVDALHVSLIDEQEFRGGRLALLKIHVGRGVELSPTPK